MGIPAFYFLNYTVKKHLHLARRCVKMSTRKENIWGISAVGSASHWQCGGQGFESPMLHQIKKHPQGGCFFISVEKRDENPWVRRRSHNAAKGVVDCQSLEYSNFFGNTRSVRKNTEHRVSPMLHQIKKHPQRETLRKEVSPFSCI